MHNGLLKAIKIFRSQRALAEALGVKQQAISNWLNLISKIPYSQVIKIVCLTKGAVRAEELAPSEDLLNQSFYEMIQDCANFQIGNQSPIVTPTEPNHTRVLIPHSPTHNEYDHLELLVPFCKHIFLKLINNEEKNTMTSEFSKIAPQFWIGKTGREILKLSVESRFLAFYLMSCPHSNRIGIYYLPLPYIAYDIKIDRSLINKALKELIDIRFCSYDFSADYVWVHEMAKYQVSDYLEEKDLRVKAVNDIFRSLPNLIFLNDFYKKYRDVFHLYQREEMVNVRDENLPDSLRTCGVYEDPLQRTFKPRKRNKNPNRERGVGEEGANPQENTETQSDK